MDFSFLRSLKAYSILLLTGALLFTTGCEDDEHDHDHDEDHTDADGFFLAHDGVEHYRQFQGVITTPDESGALTVTVGGDLELSVHFLDDDGNEIEHSDEEGEEEDHEDGLEVTVADTSIAHVEVEGHDEEGDDDGDDDHDHDHDEHGMAIHVEGVSVGSTTFTLALMHDGHSDFTSLGVTVNVVAAQ
tara:strand:+ start:1069 stop:1632 length:564 start_codon:yes stop_codon:yes gene_type:complete